MPIIKIGIIPGRLDEIATVTGTTVWSVIIDYIDIDTFDTDELEIRLNAGVISAKDCKRTVLKNGDVILILGDATLAPLYDTVYDTMLDDDFDVARAALSDWKEDIQEDYSRAKASLLKAKERKRSISVPKTTETKLPEPPKRRIISIPQEVLDHKDDHDTIKDG
jgi:hypothetical protein